MKSSKKTSKGAKAPKQSSGMKIVSTPIPAARTFRVESAKPKIKTERNVTVITGHSLFATVAGSAAYTRTIYNINPGLSEIFPWLSQRASGFEKYRWKKLTFIYVPAEAVTTTAGALYLAADYDSEDRAAQSLSDLSTYESMASGRVFETVRLNTIINRMFDGIQWKKIRSGPIRSDLELYDGCSLIFAAVSCASSAQIGQLWVDYEIELKSPQTDAPVANLRSVVQAYKAANQTLTSGLGATFLFDTVEYGGFSTSVSAGQITLPPGYYLCEVQGATLTTGTGSTISGTHHILQDGVVVTHWSTTEYADVANMYNSYYFSAIVGGTSSSVVELKLNVSGPGTITAVGGLGQTFIRFIALS